MRTSLDFDRLLESVLEEGGPQAAPAATVAVALDRARTESQRRPILRSLDSAAWPGRRPWLAGTRGGALVLASLLLLFVLAMLAVAAGSRLVTPGPVSMDGWVTTGSMAEPRVSHTATLLPDGRILVTGGGIETYTATAELFDPATGRWTPAAPMHEARSFHTATRLPDGRVLVAGGTVETRQPSAEIYDPTTDTWTETAPMTEPRGQHVAVLLLDGRVLVAGGTGPSNNPSAELFNPATGRWTRTGDLTVPRSSPGVALLRDGTVLAVGGFVPPDRPPNLAETYDPASGTWTATGPMGVGRAGDGHTATTLPDGTVLTVGDPTGVTELYDPITRTWRAGPVMGPGQDKGDHTATLLGDGRVLVAGGVTSNLGTSDVSGASQLFDPTSGTWTPTTPLQSARYGADAVALPNGQVLVVGGIDASGAPTASAELYTLPVGS
jgi:hypothetical protein